VRLKLKPDQQSPQTVVIRAEVFILEDSNRTKGKDQDDTLEVEVKDPSTQKELGRGKTVAPKIELHNDKWVWLDITSASFASDWFTQLRLTVE